MNLQFALLWMFMIPGKLCSWNLRKLVKCLKSHRPTKTQTHTNHVWICCWVFLQFHRLSLFFPVLLFLQFPLSAHVRDLNHFYSFDRFHDCLQIHEFYEIYNYCSRVFNLSSCSNLNCNTGSTVSICFLVYFTIINAFRVAKFV